MAKITIETARAAKYLICIEQNEARDVTATAAGTLKQELTLIPRQKSLREPRKSRHHQS